MVLMTKSGFWSHNQSIPESSVSIAKVDLVKRTLLAGFVLSFSNIFCDWAFVANAIISQILSMKSCRLLKLWVCVKGQRSRVKAVGLQCP